MRTGRSLIRPRAKCLWERASRTRMSVARPLHRAFGRPNGGPAGNAADSERIVNPCDSGPAGVFFWEHVK